MDAVERPRGTPACEPRCPWGPSGGRCPNANAASHDYGYDGDFDNFGDECDGGTGNCDGAWSGLGA